MPKISVLVPIYNVEKYLEECLESIISQTLQDIEVICINDGSTDGSLKIIKKYAKNDPRFVIINKKNSGYGDSMNRGLAKATGEYIGIVESDDWVEKDMFESLYSLAKENEAEVVKSNFYNYFTSPEKSHINGTVARIVHPNEVGKIIDTTVSHHIIWQQPCIWTAIYKKDFLDNYNIRFLPSPGASYQDLGYNFKVWANATRVIFTDQAFLHYRQDNESSSINSPGKVFCVSDEHKELERYLKETNLFDKFKDILFSVRWGNYNWNIQRLTPDLAEQFIRYASDEYKSLYESGDFIFTFFDANSARNLREIMFNLDMAIRRKRATFESKVSVIIPAYNCEKYIDRCLSSVINQTIKDIEIIVVDDGSTDETSDIIETYFNKDERIKVINQYNQGLSGARNTGINNSSAPFIMFCDSDDYYNPNSVEVMLDTINSTDADISAGKTNVLYENHQFTALEKENDRQYYALKVQGTSKINEQLLKKVDVSSCNKIFKRSILERNSISYPVGLWYEDAYFFYAYIWTSNTISFAPVDKPVYNYVRRDGSIMDETFKKTPKAYDHVEISFRLFHFLKDKDLFNKHAKSWNKAFVDSIYFALRNMPHGSLPFLADRVNSFLKENIDYIESINEDIAKSIQEKNLSLLSEYLYVEKPAPITEKYIDILKNILKNILYHTSPSYRVGRNVAHSLDVLHSKVDSIANKK